jgi:hypothetical protein
MKLYFGILLKRLRKTKETYVIAVILSKLELDIFRV